MLGQILSGSGLLIQAFSNTFPRLVLEQALMVIRVSFVPGADEVLFYENLKFDKPTGWRKLVTRGSQAALIGSLFATVAGGVIYNIDPRMPWVLNTLALIISGFIVWQVGDLRPRKERQKLIPELQDYFNDIRTGFAQFRLPKLRLYTPFIIAVQGLFYTTGYGLLRLVLLDRFHFSFG